jgi:uncharacterized iron-regulated protein
VDRQCPSAICSVTFVTASLLIGPAHANTPVEKWQGTVGRNHQLTGQIWDVAAGRFIDHTTLVARLAQNGFVLLGEKHDSPDHHRLQAWLLRALIAAGRRPAVGFEMFDTDQQGAIDRHLDAARTDAAGLADAVNWDRTGWPDWSLYQPIAEVALDARLPIIATNLSPRMVQTLSHEGPVSLEGGLGVRLGIDRPLAPNTHAAMATEIRDSHCGYASEALIESMITVQRARDAQMAERLAAAGRERGAVLIAGVGHVRTDWGVPVYLETRLPGSTVTSVALLEVESGETEPAAYAAQFGDGPLPFDYVWFTPRVDDVDPCEKFRMQLKELGKEN